MNSSLVRKLLFPLHERLMGRPTFAYLAELERTQGLSRPEIERLQMEKLGALLRTAAAHSPWHAERIRQAELPLDAAGGDLSLDDLRRLPTMTREDARLNRDRLAWPGVPGGAFKYNTGGSSGEPLTFYFGRARQAADQASRMRARRWWGVEVGDREVFLWGAPVELARTDRIRALRDRLFNQLMLNAFEMSPEAMDRYIQAIHDWRPRCIYGYASSLSLLAAHAASRGIDIRAPDLRVVCTTGEPLYPHQRKLIQESFGVPVANEFGSRDVGLIAHESPEGQMLVMSESVLVEVLDSAGNPAPPGAAGEAVMTGLCSEAQPFIRYRSGDVVVRSDEVCRAGRGLHVLGEVSGRSTDFVVRSDGTIMHALALIYVLRAVEAVGEFKLIQRSLQDLEVIVVPTPEWQPSHAAEIEAGLQARLGSEVRIEVRLSEAIAPEASGKHRYVVSEVALPEGLQSQVTPGGGSGTA